MSRLFFRRSAVHFPRLQWLQYIIPTSLTLVARTSSDRAPIGCEESVNSRNCEGSMLIMTILLKLPRDLHIRICRMRLLYKRTRSVQRHLPTSNQGIWARCTRGLRRLKNCGVHVTVFWRYRLLFLSGSSQFVCNHYFISDVCQN